VDDEHLVFTVDEMSQGVGGTDLNGDGDVDVYDFVLHVFNLKTGRTTNVKLAVIGDLAPSKEWLAFAVDEMSQGEDRNDDGDTVDEILHVFDVKTGTTTNVKLAVIGDLAPSKEWLAFAVHERRQGGPDGQGTDLNDDGDVNDVVLHVFDVKKGRTTNVKLNVRRFKLGEDWIAFTVMESQESPDDLGTDLNRDGDAVDEVLHVFDVKKGRTTNVRRHVALPFFGFTAGEDHIAFSVAEASQGGADLNDDGDASDVVLHVVNP
jgi:hypothetical protein